MASQPEPGHSYPQAFHDLITRQASLHPQNVAISHGIDKLSYEELEVRSDRLAELLKKRGVQSHDQIPVLTSRCPLMVLCFIAVSKAGACYVPVDVDSWSRARIRSILDMVAPRLILKTHSLPFVISENDITKQDIDHACDSSLPLAISKSRQPIQPEDPVYLIFTSGTSGAPKGVIIPHRSLLNYVQQGGSVTPFNMNVAILDRVLLLFSVGFDACTGVVFSTLCNGGHLVISDPATVVQDLKHCTILPTTPSLLESVQIDESLESIHSIYLGGESPSPILVKRLWTPSRKIFNAYGPTETTISSAICELLPDRTVTLGGTMAGSLMLLLDAQMREVGEGEICISGPGLATGYYKNPELTKNRFIYRRGHRLYRTGDVGRRGPDGIAFLGRKDSLVKNRGFLVDIETNVIPVLQSYSGVTAAAAIMSRGRLMASVTPASVDPLKVRKWLSERYDQFLVPDVVRAMDQLPITANGKLDTTSLKHKIEADDPTANTSGSKIELLRSAFAGALEQSTESIRMDQSFWEQGGNSLAAMKLLSILHKQSLTVQMKELFAQPDLISLSKAIYPIETSSAEIVLRPVPMTKLQSRLLYPCSYQPKANYMIISMSFNDNNLLKDDTLKKAWRTLLWRHSIFSTAFDPLLQTMFPHPLEDIHWREVVVTKETAATAHREASQNILSHPPLLEQSGAMCPYNGFCLLKCEDGESTLLWIVHHSQIDGWSITILMRELRAILDGHDLVPTMQFSEFAKRRAEFGIDDPFWADHCANYKPAASLEARFSFPAGRTLPDQENGEQFLSLDMSPKDLEEASRNYHVTSTVVVFAAWGLLLGSYLDQREAVFGIVLSGRSFPMPNVESIVGPMLNTCPFPVDLSCTTSKCDMLRKLQESLLLITDHQWSADKFLDEKHKKHCTPFFDSILAVELELAIETESNACLPKGWSIRHKDFSAAGLMILIEQQGGTVISRFQHNEGRYDACTVSRIQRHFHNLILAILDPETQTIPDLEGRMMDRGEANQFANGLLPKNCHPSSSHRACTNLKDAFEQAAEIWPNKVAVESSTETIPYAELDARSSRVAVILSRYVKAGDVVAVHSDGTIPWLIAVLSIMKHGGVYLPLDAKLPLSRKEYMVRISKASGLVFPSGGSASYEQIHVPDGCAVLNLEKLMESFGHVSKTESPTRTIKYNDPAFIIFTSGSTGYPKAIQVHHGPALSAIQVIAASLECVPGRKLAQVFSVGFDVSVGEIFGSLCFGSTLVLKDPADAVAHLSRANVCMATPSLLSTLSPGAFPNLDTVILAGEVVPPSLAESWAADRKLYNAYGPCECTIIVSIALLRAGREVTIGKPIFGTSIYVLDSLRRPCPIGVGGELCISGPSVTNGYIENGAESFQRGFSQDPFAVGRRMFCTGDRASWTESGDLRFLGRLDNQVKVSGFRVELEEVDDAMRKVCQTVQTAATILYNGNLYGFVTPSWLDTKDIRESLESILPYYARPVLIKALSSIPTSSNQKIDRRQLRELAATARPNGQGREPNGTTELLVERVWRSVLNIDESMPLKTDDDFLSLGGNSLKQIKVAQEISDALGHRLPLSCVICNPTISLLSKSVDANEARIHNRSFLDFCQQVPESFSGLSHLESEILNLHNESPAQPTFNIACQLQLQGNVDDQMLCEAISSIIKSTDILRTRFKILGSRISRLVSMHTQKPIHKLLECEIEGAEVDLLDELINRPFDLSKDQPIRVLVSKGREACTFLIVVHHIVADKQTVHLLLQNIAAEYRARRNDRNTTTSQNQFIAPKYVNWAWWDTQANCSLRIPAKTRRFWQRYLAPPIASLFKVPPSPTAPTVVETRHLPIPVKPLQSTAAHLAAVALALREVLLLPTPSLLICVPNPSRSEPGTSRICGAFLDRLPVRIAYEDEDIVHLGSFLDAMQASLDAALAHAVSFREIEACVPGVRPIALGVMVTVHRKEDAWRHSFQVPEVKVEEMVVRARGAAKFPMMIEFLEGESLEVRVEYAAGAFSDVYVEKFLKSLGEVFKELRLCVKK